MNRYDRQTYSNEWMFLIFKYSFGVQNGDQREVIESSLDWDVLYTFYSSLFAFSSIWFRIKWELCEFNACVSKYTRLSARRTRLSARRTRLSTHSSLWTENSSLSSLHRLLGKNYTYTKKNVNVHQIWGEYNQCTSVHTSLKNVKKRKATKENEK